MAPKIVAVPSLNSAWTGKYDKNKSGAAHHNTIVLHNAQWPCQKCLGFSSFSFGTILSGAGLQTQTIAGVLIHVLAWRHRAPLCCCRVTQQHIVQETCSITSPPPHGVIRHESRNFVLVAICYIYIGLVNSYLPVASLIFYVSWYHSIADS